MWGAVGFGVSDSDAAGRSVPGHQPAHWEAQPTKYTHGQEDEENIGTHPTPNHISDLGVMIHFWTPPVSGPQLPLYLKFVTQNATQVFRERGQPVQGLAGLKHIAT